MDLVDHVVGTFTKRQPVAIFHTWGQSGTTCSLTGATIAMAGKMPPKENNLVAKEKRVYVNTSKPAEDPVTLDID